MRTKAKTNKNIEKKVMIDRFEPVDRCLFWKEERTLIIGDLHLGYEEFLQEQGWSFPNTQLEESLLVLEKILKQTGQLKKVIILGDIKHYFGGILGTEWEDFYLIISLLKKNLEKNGEIIIIKGNHDKMIEPIIKKYDSLSLGDSYFYNGVLFFHGDRGSFEKNSFEMHDKKVELIVIAHFHPAISIRDAAKQEKYRCFLKGKTKGKEIIIVPSFFPLNEGTDILQERLMLEDWFSVSGFEVYIIADSVYDFGKVNRFL